jgi:hypothetical protein
MISAKDKDMLSINDGYDYSERERTVLELYKQGKSTRYIAKELRMSLRDISTILRKNQVSHGIPIIDNDINNNNNNNSNNNNKSPNQIATQAYKLFSKGTKLSNVAIELGLREKEASKLFGEFLRLNGQQELYDIYLDEKYYLRSVLKLYRLMKREGMTIDNNNIEWFVSMVKTGMYKIPEIQKQYEKAKDELEVIEYKRVMSKHELDNMNKQIILLRRSVYQLSTTCNNKRNEIAYLQNQIQVLEGHINGITNRNQQQQQQEEIQNESYS